jgi:hypothetical protein
MINHYLRTSLEETVWASLPPSRQSVEADGAKRVQFGRTWWPLASVPDNALIQALVIALQTKQAKAASKAPVAAPVVEPPVVEVSKRRTRRPVAVPVPQPKKVVNRRRRSK